MPYYLEVCIEKQANTILLIPTPGFPYLTLYLIEKPFEAFANRADPDQAALVRAV